MKTVKVWFCDYFSSCDFEQLFCRLLRDKFNIILDKDNPDIVIYSVLGDEHLKYLDKILIFWTGEAITPDFNVCDYAIGFDYLSFGDRYLRYPIYKFCKSDIEHFKAVKRDKNKKFCCFVVSQSEGMSQRKHMFELLSQYKHVDSGGKFLNNIGGPIGALIEDKFEFQSNYKFCICFENCIYDGYTTEKIVQAFAAGCIPIYLGNPLINKEFDPKSFVNCHDFASLEDACDYIKKIDNDDKLYNEIIRNIKFKKEIFDEQPLTDFLVHIFSQDFKKAKRSIPQGFANRRWSLGVLINAKKVIDKANRWKYFFEHPFKVSIGKFKRLIKRQNKKV